MAIGTKESRDADRARHESNFRMSDEEKSRAYEERVKAMEAKREAEGKEALPVVGPVFGWFPAQQPLQSFERLEDTSISGEKVPRGASEPS